MGRVVAGIRHKEAVITDIFSAATVEGWRKEFPAWMDADDKMVAG
jgi:hypothetical protein